MPILSDIIQGSQPVDLGVIEVLKKLTQPQGPPPDPVSSGVGQAVNSAYNAYGDLSDKIKLPLLKDLQKNIFTNIKESQQQQFGVGGEAREQPSILQRIGQGVGKAGQALGNLQEQGLPTPFGITTKGQFGSPIGGALLNLLRIPGSKTLGSEAMGQVFAGQAGLTGKKADDFAKDYISSFSKQTQQKILSSKPSSMGGQPSADQAGNEEIDEDESAVIKDAIEKKPSLFWKIAARVGFPALSAILGATGAIPLEAGAGLAAGYVKGYEGERDLELKKETAAAELGIKKEELGLKKSQMMMDLAEMREKASAKRAEIGMKAAEKLGEGGRIINRLPKITKAVYERLIREMTVGNSNPMTVQQTIYEQLKVKSAKEVKELLIQANIDPKQYDIPND